MTRNRITHERVLVALLMLFAAFPICAARAETGNRNSQSPPNVAQLIQQLKSPELQRRRDAARELGTIEPLPPEAIQALAEVLRTEETNSIAGGYAIKALGKAGAPAIPALSALTKSRNPEACQSAIAALGAMANREPAAWPILIDAFKSDFNRGNAAYALAKLGPPAVPLLVKALKSDDPRVRAGGAQTIAQMGWLVQIFGHSSAQARRQMGIELATTADLAPAAPELTATLSDADPKVREQAAIALAYADPKNKQAVPILTNLLNDKNFLVHNAAAQALRNMGSSARDAAPALERTLLSNPDWVVRALAADTLGKIGGAKACESLAQAIKKEQNGGVCIAAARSLVEIRPACPQALSTLAEALGKPCSAPELLAKFGKPAVPALTAALKNPDLDVRKDAVKALAQMKPLSPEAADALMLALKDPSLQVRSASATALQNAGGEAQRAALAEQQREDQLYAEESKPDSRRYSREQIIAPIPADADHKNPLTLAYLFPVVPVGGSVQQARFLITLYTGTDRPERLVFWKKVGADQYLKVKVISSDFPGVGGIHYETPTVFTAGVQVEDLGQTNYEMQQFVNVPVVEYRGGADQVFAIRADALYPVKIESPVKWYASKLGPREGVDAPGSWNSFSSGRLAFSFPVWNADDPVCCPTAGRVTGTYKIIEDAGTSGGGGAAMYVPGHRPVISINRPTGPTWKMVVASAIREPMPGAVRPSKKPATRKSR